MHTSISISMLPFTTHHLMEILSLAGVWNPRGGYRAGVIG